MLKKSFAIIFLLCSASVALAGFLPELRLPTSNVTYGFLIPNEEYPSDAIPLFDHAPAGVYIAVGTERGFISAALTPNITHLLLADVDYEVVRYNRLNIALLKVAKSRRDYLHLRLGARAKEWKARAYASSIIDKKEIRLLADATIWKWWKEKVRDYSKFRRFHAPLPHDRSVPFVFKSANYLYYDALFERIKDLAVKNRIDVVQLDLRDHL